MLLPTNGCCQNRTTFLSLCVCCEGWRTNQSCKRNLTLCEMQGASQFLMHQYIVAEFGRALYLQATKRLICRKICKQWTKFQVKKRFDRPTRLLPELVVVFFLTCICIMNVMCWMCSLCCCTCEDLTLKGTDSNNVGRSVAWRP